MRGFGFTLLGALVLVLLWAGAAYHYQVVADYAVRHLEPNAGESPKVHEKRQLQELLSSFRPDVDQLLVPSPVPSLPSKEAGKEMTNDAPSIPDHDGVQLTLVVGLAGIVLAL